ncbi:MAG: hypothetical protein FJW40_04335 [Acidobacteria bacterium]|nr:hypothetical protein [Acidobacteriota bacterium]
MLKPLAATLALAALALAQQNSPLNPAQPEAVLIPIKTLNGDSFDRLVRLISVFNARVTADERLRTILVYAPPEVTGQIRRVIDQLDRPGSEAAIGRNIDLTLTFLRCSAKPQAGTLPPEIEQVAKQLRSVTQFKDIQVWDTVPLRLQEGRESDYTTRIAGANALTANGAFVTATIAIRPQVVSTRGNERTVRFDKVRVDFRLPYATGGSVANGVMVNTQFQFFNAGFNTAGEFKEGQKAVLGKVTGMEDDTAIFVVLSLKVLD